MPVLVEINDKKPLRLQYQKLSRMAPDVTEVFGDANPQNDTTMQSIQDAISDKGKTFKSTKAM